MSAPPSAPAEGDEELLDVDSDGASENESERTSQNETRMYLVVKYNTPFLQ